MRDAGGCERHSPCGTRTAGHRLRWVVDAATELKRLWRKEVLVVTVTGLTRQATYTGHGIFARIIGQTWRMTSRVLWQVITIMMSIPPQFGGCAFPLSAIIARSTILQMTRTISMYCSSSASIFSISMLEGSSFARRSSSAFDAASSGRNA